MATIIPPKGASLPLIKTLKYGKKTFKLSIYETTDCITLFIGGNNLFCIDAFLYKPDSPFSRIPGFNLNEAVLSHIYYNSDCTLNKNFERGTDTLNILSLLISYIKDNYKHVTTINLNDTSFRECDNGQIVELSEMSYIRTGKTWYETHFDAKLKDEDRDIFLKIERNFQNKKENISWNMMKNFITGELPLSDNILAEMYNTAKTWQEFFGTLSNKIGISKFCIFVAPWLHRFILTVMDYNFSNVKYTIDIKNIPYIDYTSSNQQGGKRQTLKKRVNARPMLLV
jgi:hypothetical protein